jgi:mono/diheme cytochrome c family protein
MRGFANWVKTLLPVAAMIVVAVFALFAFLPHYEDWKAPADARNLRNPLPSDASAIAAGKVIYQDHCVKCHGEAGNGKTSYAKWNSVRPADFTKTGHMAGITDGEMFWKISEGRRPMPAFKDKLTEEERWQAVDYLRTFANPALPASASPGKARHH